MDGLIWGECLPHGYAGGRGSPELSKEIKIRIKSKIRIERGRGQRPRFHGEEMPLGS
jgi:hypothetical protein